MPSTVPATLGAATTWDSGVPERGPPRRRRLRFVGSGIAPTVVDTPVEVHRANRFSPLTAEIDDEPVSQVPPPIGVVAPVHQVGESDTDSVEFHAIHIARASHGSESEDVVPFERPNDPSDTVLDEVPVTRATRAGFASLDCVDLMTMFRSRACIKSPPHFLRGAYKSTMRLALDRWRRPSKMSRMEVVRPPPTDVVVQTCPWGWCRRADCWQDSLHFPTGIGNNC